MRISGDLQALVEQTRPQVVIQATCSTLTDAMAEITTLLRGGANVISIAEEMAWPAASAPAIAEQLHALALAEQVSVLGTGVNPGFVLDTLVLALSGVCAEIESISATRVNDLSPYGPTVLHSQGVGLSAEAFRQGLNDGIVVGHIGFVQSLHMIAHTLGWDLERIDETREPIIAQQRRETPFAIVEPGQVAGCLHTAVAYRQGRRVIELVHPQQVRPELAGVETGDSIEIRGTPDIRLAGSPEIPGGEGTIALAVNMIGRVLNAPPGLHSMADLPLPAAMLGDVRASLQREYGRD
jgi:4-hydroxy-tetrahydrodipicolinate reductase